MAHVAFPACARRRAERAHRNPGAVRYHECRIVTLWSVWFGGSVREHLGEAEFEARYRALRAQYLSDLPQRRRAVASLWDASLQDVASPAWCELHTLTHRLAGSAPCYGLDEVGEAAQELDRLLSSKPPCREPAMLRPPIAQLLDRLDAAITAEVTSLA